MSADHGHDDHGHDSHGGGGGGGASIINTSALTESPAGALAGVAGGLVLGVGALVASLIR